MFLFPEESSKSKNAPTLILRCAKALAINPDKPEEVTDVLRVKIEVRMKSPISMMPTDQLDTLSKEEILDLLMYLSSGGNLGHTAFQQ